MSCLSWRPGAATLHCFVHLKQTADPRLQLFVTTIRRPSVYTAADLFHDGTNPQSRLIQRPHCPSHDTWPPWRHQVHCTNDGDKILRRPDCRRGNEPVKRGASRSVKIQRLLLPTALTLNHFVDLLYLYSSHPSTTSDKIRTLKGSRDSAQVLHNCTRQEDPLPQKECTTLCVN